MINTVNAVDEISKILGKCVRNFQGECSISSDIYGEDIDFIRIGTTDDDVAEYPEKNWLHIRLKNGKELSCSLEFFDIE